MICEVINFNRLYRGGAKTNSTVSFVSSDGSNRKKACSQWLRYCWGMVVLSH